MQFTDVRTIRQFRNVILLSNISVMYSFIRLLQETPEGNPWHWRGIGERFSQRICP